MNAEQVAKDEESMSFNSLNEVSSKFIDVAGLVFAIVITAYAYNGDTNIFTFIGVGITICSFWVMVKN
jgi:hypothetical protein